MPDTILGRQIDAIGFVGELEDWKKTEKEAVKKRVQVGDRYEGVFFQALHAEGGSDREVDADAFVKLWEANKMTRPQFLSAIRVSAARAAEILPEDVAKRITTTDPRPSSLRVTRIKGVEVKLVNAVRALADKIDPPNVVAAKAA